MKKLKIELVRFMLLFFFSLICLSVKSQSKMQDPDDFYLITERKISQEIIEGLKKTKTIFFISYSNPSALDTLKSVIQSTWDLTPIIFEDIEKFDFYSNNPDYSYFIIEAGNESSRITIDQYYLTLRYIEEINKKGKAKTIGLCRIELYPKFESYGVMNARNAEEKRKILHKSKKFYNYSPVILRAQLLAFKHNLLNNIRPREGKTIVDENLVQKLSNDTLYVPRSILKRYGTYSAKATSIDDDIFKHYPYSYKICDDQELYEIFINQKRGRYLFEFVKSSLTKFIIVYDLKDGKMIYKRMTPHSNEIKPKDLEKFE